MLQALRLAVLLLSLGAAARADVRLDFDARVRVQPHDPAANGPPEEVRVDVEDAPKPVDSESPVTAGEDPSLVGAREDLGDLYFRRDDMARARLCWDVARTIGPGHAMLAPVGKFEVELAREHPEYFRP